MAFINNVTDTLSDVLPRPSVQKCLHGGQGDAELVGQTLLCLPRFSEGAGYEYILDGQFCLREPVAHGSTPAFSAVLSVFQWSSRSEIPGVHVTGNICAVQDIEPWGDGADKEFVAHPVSEIEPTPVPDLAIPLAKGGASPQPGNVGRWRLFWHDRPEDGFQALARCRHGFSE